MRGLVAQRQVIGNVGESEVLSVLGEDGKIYPISNDLIERYDVFKASIEIGFTREDLLSDDPFLEGLIRLQRSPWEAVVFSDSLSVFQVGVIAYFWVLQHPGVKRLVIEHEPFFKSTHGNCKIRQAIVLAKKSFVDPQSVELVDIYENIQIVTEFRRCADMVSENDDVKMVARAVLDLMEVSYRSKVGEYGFSRDYARSTCIDMWASLIQYDRDNTDVFKDSGISVTKHQTMLAMRLVDEMDAWDIEFEVES